MRVAWIVLPLLLLLTPTARALPDEAEQEVRELLAAAIRGNPAPERVKALAEAHPLVELAAALGKGPALPDGLPAPREVEGEADDLSRFGDVVVGYSFAHGGHVYRYAVDVPEDYDPSEPRGVLLDPGHGSGAKKDAEGKAGFLGMYRRFTKEAGIADWLVVRTEIVEQIGAGGLREEEPEDEIVLVFDAFFRDLLSRFAVDPDRIYVTGLSQTGFWAWYLGSRGADRYAGVLPMSSVTWQVDRFAGNLIGLPVFVLHGDADRTCPVGQARATCATLSRMGAPVEYVELAGAGHEYAVWSRLPTGLGKLAKGPRERYPRRVSKSVQTSGDRWCHWLRIDEIEREGNGEANASPTAGVDAEVDGQTVRLYSEGVKGVTVCLSSEMLDLEKSVTVTWNGKQVHKGVVTPSFETLFHVAAEKCDWSALFEASISLRR